MLDGFVLFDFVLLWVGRSGGYRNGAPNNSKHQGYYKQNSHMLWAAGSLLFRFPHTDGFDHIGRLRGRAGYLGERHFLTEDARHGMDFEPFGFFGE